MARPEVDPEVELSRPLMLEFLSCSSALPLVQGFHQGLPAGLLRGRKNEDRGFFPVGGGFNNNGMDLFA